MKRPFLPYLCAVVSAALFVSTAFAGNDNDNEAPKDGKPATESTPTSHIPPLPPLDGGKEPAVSLPTTQKPVLGGAPPDGGDTLRPGQDSMDIILGLQKITEKEEVPPEVRTAIDGVGRRIREIREEEEEGGTEEGGGGVAGLASGGLTAAGSAQSDGVRSPPGTNPAEIRALEEFIAVVPVLTADSRWTAPAEGARNQISNQIGYLLGQAGDHDNTMALADNVLGRDPDNRDALNNRAMANHGLGRYQRAVRDANRVVDMDDENERAYTARALAYYEMKEYARAVDDAERALALNKNNQTALYVFRLARTRVTTAKDLKLSGRTKSMAERVKAEYKAQMNQQSQIESTQPPPAKIKTGKGTGPIARMVDSLNRQARGKIEMGDYHGAIKIADRALKRDPSNVQALYTRAAARNLTGKYERAVEDASAVLEKDPSHSRALNTRASALLQLRDFRRALRDADRAIGLNPDDAYAFKNRARAKERIGDLAGMISDYKHAARLNPQFEPDLAAASEKYGLNLEAEALQALPRAEITKEAKAGPSKRQRFLMILGFSVIGGILIAFGIVHVFFMRPKEVVDTPSIPGAGTQTAQAIAAGPGLEKGYSLERVIGNGGMGVVYQATDKALGRKVAIKQMRDEIRDNLRERERFLQEARIVAVLHHPNIVDIHSIVEEDGNLYMVFEFVEGRTVERILAKKQRLSVREAALIARGVCNALTYAHAKGVIHRDLKPSNMMVTTEGMIKVMDFGIARLAKDAAANAATTQTVVGTPLYMAPEQEQGLIRVESDLYALGACLYEMVTGIRPFKGSTTTPKKLAKAYTRPSRVLKGLPPGLDALIDAALEPDPNKRIRTAQDFAARLDALGVVTNT